MKTDMFQKQYIAPLCEEADLAPESAVLQASIQDFVDGGELS